MYGSTLFPGKSITQDLKVEWPLRHMMHCNFDVVSLKLNISKYSFGRAKGVTKKKVLCMLRKYRPFSSDRCSECHRRPLVMRQCCHSQKLTAWSSLSAGICTRKCPEIKLKRCHSKKHFWLRQTKSIAHGAEQKVLEKDVLNFYFKTFPVNVVEAELLLMLAFATGSKVVEALQSVTSVTSNRLGCREWDMFKLYYYLLLSSVTNLYVFFNLTFHQKLFTGLVINTTNGKRPTLGHKPSTREHGIFYWQEMWLYKRKIEDTYCFEGACKNERSVRRNGGRKCKIRKSCMKESHTDVWSDTQTYRQIL